MVNEEKWTLPERCAANKLIRAECCNFYDGRCCYDRPCKQIGSDHFTCRWFKDCVLPSDKQLQIQITGMPSEDADGMTIGKLCLECGTPYLPNSNRAKYCPDCARRIRNEQKRASRNRVNPER